MHTLEHWSPEKQVSEWIETEGLSLRKIEELTGISRSKLSKFKSGSGSLTVSDLMSLSAVLDRNPRDIFGSPSSMVAVDGAYAELGSRIGEALMDTVEHRSRSSGRGLSIDDVVSWHEVTGGHLYKSEEIRSHLLAVEPLSGVQERLKIIGVGQNSLAWDKIRREGRKDVRPIDVEEFVSSSIPEMARNMLLKGYVDIQNTGGRRYLDRKLFHRSSSGAVVFTTYVTVLMEGHWHTGERVIWNFSKEIRSRLATEAELEGIQGFLDQQ